VSLRDEPLPGELANMAIYGYALMPGQVARHCALGEDHPAPTPVTKAVQYTSSRSAQAIAGNPPVDRNVSGPEHSSV
jgi:hypothetical protein